MALCTKHRNSRLCALKAVSHWTRGSSVVNCCVCAPVVREYQVQTVQWRRRLCMPLSQCHEPAAWKGAKMEGDLQHFWCTGFVERDFCMSSPPTYSWLEQKPGLYIETVTDASCRAVAYSMSKPTGKGHPSGKTLFVRSLSNMRATHMLAMCLIEPYSAAALRCESAFI